MIRGCFKSIFGNIKASVNQPKSLPYLLREETKGKTFVTEGARVKVSPSAGKRFTRGLVYFLTSQTSSAFDNILISTGGGTS
ncbi:MAG: hypothetical protein ACKPGB_02865, partial [Dolichospermum sp.]